MKLDVNFNSLLPFKQSEKIPASFEHFLSSEKPPLYYDTPQCSVLIQQMHLFERSFWYTVVNAADDNLLLRFDVSPGLQKLLIYSIRNDNEIMFLHQDIGIDIAENDYCYLGGGFQSRDLRVLVSKGNYQLLAFPFSAEQDDYESMKSADTFTFINKFLFALGLLNTEARK
ncbi:hypothetical protein [Chitinophaga rhizophila]|uniref:Uncharacterized protein n=1 Tax=Chitinophaga rhizophila TaxID=2866212 RepID=A0ABS7GC94_9BACT|nr:hypothetical protein [Chitinophaga rhizophila]MBW8684148.1 hypothetical protein [Chitinophaga rhizophila]